MRYFMQHWAQDYWRDVAQATGKEGAPFRHTASNQLGPRGVQPGDRLYVVGVEDGRLLLIGRMDVAHLVRTPEAVRLLGTSDLYRREWHAIARAPLSPLSFERWVPEEIARAVRTEDGKALRIDPTVYRIPSMALVTGRFLAPESAALLDSLIDAQVAESEEVRDVEFTARGRSWGDRLTAAQRKAIERQAVSAAIEYFANDGWDVDDVGLHEAYDLHCTYGRRTLYVEVKGSTGPLASIALTHGEVDHARRHRPATALFVMHGIKLDGTATKPRTRPGEVHLERPWEPKRSRLRAVAYSYRLA